MQYQDGIYWFIYEGALSKPQCGRVVKGVLELLACNSEAPSSKLALTASWICSRSFLGIRGDIWLWLKNYLPERGQFVRINRCDSDTHIITHGVP